MSAPSFFFFFFFCFFFFFFIFFFGGGGGATGRGPRGGGGVGAGGGGARMVRGRAGARPCTVGRAVSGSGSPRTPRRTACRPHWCRPT
ncbi:hypothetical protein AAHZ94_32160 [Streptomyces sp. HSW2009]|uniref:hypothetical protein n=1 Tax=Streptomyces sp. HSW2009 TaxID=3142890 RepID=UPI0032EE52DA